MDLVHVDNLFEAIWNGNASFLPMDADQEPTVGDEVELRFEERIIKAEITFILEEYFIRPVAALKVTRCITKGSPHG